MMNVISDYRVLILISILTSLAVEGIKKILVEKHRSFSANILAVIVSTVLSIIVCVSDAVFNDTAFDLKFIWYLIDVIVVNAIISMVGYDKFKQTISQLQNIKGGSNNDDSRTVKSISNPDIKQQ